MPELIIEHDTQDGWQILRFSGAVDTGNFAQFEEAIFAAIDTQPQQLKLDFKYLQGINSTALGLVLATSRELNQQGGELKIAHINSHLKAILDLLGASKLHDDDDDDAAGSAVRTHC